MSISPLHRLASIDAYEDLTESTMRYLVNLKSNNSMFFCDNDTIYK
jgi:hypothetical protein